MPSYYIILALQAICVIHCLRKGTQQKWIWLIVFLPLIGCVIYIFSEMFTGRDMEQVQSGLGSILNPSGRVSKLEENLRFADTFHNRVTLADAYLASGMNDKAIDLYESSLTGAFEENEHVHLQLIVAYFNKKRYEDVIRMATKIYRLPQFLRSRAHMLYAMSLEQTGRKDLAEKEFRTMMGRYAYFESRYQYGLFLLRANRTNEARQVFREMVDESSHLSPREKRYNRTWFGQAREELKKMQAGNAPS
jgi:pentatricopeptide repeat protein